jgi:hypothetical protein
MVLIKDFVRGTSAVDATKDLHVGTAVGMRNVRREASIGGFG